jgi:hypothetical protein
MGVENILAEINDHGREFKVAEYGPTQCICNSSSRFICGQWLWSYGMTDDHTIHRYCFP